MFHRRYPDLKISATTLERVYNKGGVKFKAINRIKKTIDFANDHYRRLFDTMVQQMSKA